MNMQPPQMNISQPQSNAPFNPQQQPGYDQKTGYDQQPGYAQQPNYPPQTGFAQQPQLLNDMLSNK